MSNFYNIKLRLTLCTLQEGNDIPNARKKEELGEVSMFNVKYALNSIPKGTLLLPVGNKLLKSGGFEESYAHTKKITSLADSNQPVGVFVTNESENNIPGLPKGEFCIFKGFIEGCTFVRETGQASIAVQVGHWLQSLTVFPLVNTMIAPHSAGSIGRGFMLTASSSDRDRLQGTFQRDNAKKRSFTFVKDAYEMLLQTDGTLDLWASLKSIISNCMPVLGEITNKYDPGYVSKDSLERAANALKAIGGKHQTLISSFSKDNTSAIHLGIADYIADLSLDQLRVSTPWDKLVSEFLPSFFMAIIPLVDKAYVIPIPGSFISDRTCKQLTQNEYSSINLIRNTRPMLGGVALTYENSKNIEIALRYPQDPKPGPIELISAPAWMPSRKVLNVASGAIVSGGAGENSIYDHFQTEMALLSSAKEEEDILIAECVDTMEKVLRSIVRNIYQTRCLQGRTCTITAPFRVDITPGAQLKIEPPDLVGKDIQKESEDAFLYGTVSGITFNINTTTAQTVYEISNIRTHTEMNDPKLTSPEGIFFKGAWEYKDGRLYAQEDSK